MQDREGRWYSVRIRPYRTTDNKIDGAVILLVDVDETKRAFTEFMAMVHQPLLTLRGDLRVQYANEAFHKTFNTKAEDVDNQVVYDIHDGVWNFAALKNLLEGTLPEKNRVENIRLDHKFGELGRKILLVSARRLHQRSKGTQITLVAFSEVKDLKNQ